MVDFGPAPFPEPMNPVLYILMRNDMESMNTGKAVAQGAHAANQFTHDYGENDPPDELFEHWKRQADGFGTTVCLAVNENLLHRVVEFASQAGFKAGITHDPSYPLRDGQVTHLLPLDTCGYVFGEKDDLRALLGQFDLHP